MLSASGGIRSAADSLRLNLNTFCVNVVTKVATHPSAQARDRNLQESRVSFIAQSAFKRLPMWFYCGGITVMEIDFLRSIEKVATGVHMHMFVVQNYIEGDIKTTYTELSR